MVGTTLRLEAIRPTAFDGRLAQLGGGTLTRVASVTYLDSDRVIEEATRQLAFSGVRVTQCDGAPAPRADHRPALAFDLVPLDESLQAIDVVELREIPLGDASAALMHRRLAWLNRAHAARDACRRLLRDEDVLLGWRRTVWCPVSSLRLARRRFGLRPVVFDHGALERYPLRWTYVSERAVQRWAFP